MRRIAGILSCLAAACSSPKVGSYAGFVDAPVAAVAAQVSGRVAAVPIREGQQVKLGQLLAQLDDRERAAMVAEAEANLQHARDALAEAQRNAEAAQPTIKSAEFDIARQQAELEDASLELERNERMFKSGASTARELDAAKARFDQARSAVASMGATGQATRRRVIAALASVRTAQAQLSANEAALALARVQLAEATITSPFDGFVAEQNLQPGEWAAPGTPVVTVEDVTRQWVRIDVEETALGGLRLGDPASISVVAFPGKRWSGHVIEIGAEGEFALNRDVKRGRPDVRTFRVRIGLDQPEAQLRPGMTADATLEPRR